MKWKAALVIAVLASILHAGTFDKKPSRYVLDAKLDWAKKSIKCRMRLEFFNGSEEPLDRLYFTVYGNKRYPQNEKQLMELASNYFKVRVFPNGFDENRTEIEKVRQDFAMACRSQFVREDGTLLEVCLAKPVEPGRWGKIEIYFTLHLANMRGFLGWMEDTMMLAYWYPILNVHDEKGWHNNPMMLYHEPFYTDAAYYKVSFEMDESLVLAAPGLVRVEKVEGGKKLVSVNGGLLREFTCAVSRDYTIFRQERDGFVAESYCSPEDSFYGQLAAQFAAEALEYYGVHFGQYPHKTAEKLVVAQVYTPWLGTEFSGIIFIDKRAYRLPHILVRHFDFLISHETAHQWWHYLVGNDQYREEWLDEAFASYSQQLYLEDKYGLGDNYYVLPKGLGFLPKTSFRRARQVRYLAQARRGMDEEILKPIDSFKYLENIFAMPYDKGLFVLDMLKKRVGDEKFFKILREYARRFAYKKLLKRSRERGLRDFSMTGLGQTRNAIMLWNM